MSTVSFNCACGESLTAAFSDEGDDCDFVHCECGNVYVVTKPFIAMPKALHEWATRDDEED